MSYYKYSEFEDILQTAVLGAIKAIQTYDSDRGQLAPYLSSCVKWELDREFQSNPTQSNGIPKNTEVETHDTLSDFLPQLCFSDRQLLKYKVCGYTRNEISKLMNIPIPLLNIKIHKLYELIKNANKD